MRRETLRNAVVAAVCGMAVCANAADYPGKPIRLVVAQAAGGNADLVARLNREAASAVRSPDIADRLAAEGGEPVGNSAAEFAAYVKREIARWSTVVKATGMRAG